MNGGLWSLISITGLVCLDIPVFYLNSVFSQPVYAKEKPVGLIYAANFFSSCQNPIGMVLKNRWQWLLYLAIRFSLALGITALLLALPRLIRRGSESRKTLR